jgi:hypothetical protein
MLITAGRLLATQPLVNGSYDWDRDRFENWISRHDLSRRDGRWLADRRDPEPPGLGLKRVEGDEYNDWLGSVELGFEQVLFPAEGSITLWGSWSRIGSNRTEHYSIRSALVSSEHSLSLLAALQTVENSHLYLIPDAVDDLQIKEGPFQLKGWIVDRPGESGIDDRDPWSGSVRFPAPQPASFVTEMMQLSPDPDRRSWLNQRSAPPPLRSEVWGSFAERDTMEQPSGQRLHVTRQFVVDFLSAVSMDMVVEVSVERRSRHQPYETPDDNELRNIPPSTRIFIIKNNGTICAL